MKVGLVFDASLDKADGVAQYVLTVGDWLAKQGHVVHYLVGQTKRTDLPNLHSLSNNVTVRFNQNRVQTPLPAKKSAIKALLVKEKFDVLHVMMPYSPFMAARVVSAAGPATAVVGTFHIAPASWIVNAGNKLLGLYLCRNLRLFSRFMSVSEPAQLFAHQTFGIESVVVPNTAPLQKFFDAKSLAAYKKCHTVVFLGRLVERKGCQHLLAAVAKLARDKRWPPDTKVIICGDGPLRSRLTQYVHEEGLTGIVEFKGFITEDEKPRYLASADVAVFPSTGGESFGIVLIEAMAAARGVVLAGDNPGYTSVMHERPESLFAPTDTDTLADLLHKNLSDAALRKDAVAWQRRHAHHFEPDVVGKKIVDVYTQALREKRK